MGNTLTTIGTLNAYAYVPESKSKLPILIFFPGSGEIGTNAELLLYYGPSKFINSGWDPGNMIIISIQPTVQWANPAYVDAIIEDVKKTYDNDGRIFLTGLSAGAYAIQNYVGYSKTYSDKVTAIVSFSAPEPESYFNNTLWTQPSWGFCGKDDSFYAKMSTLYTKNGKKFTTYAGGHSGWNIYYNPSWKENGVSIYDFLLSAGVNTTDPSTPVDNTQPKTIIITAGSDGGVYKSAKDYSINPGDTVILSGNFSYFNLKDLNGTSDNRITIKANGKVVIGGYKGYAFNMSNSSYFDIIGTDYNIIIYGGTDGKDAVGTAFNKCNNFTITGLEITGVSVGIMAKTTPDATNPDTYGDNWAYENITISGNYIHDTTGEGMYLGYSDSGLVNGVYAYRMKFLVVTNNVLTNTGWDGIQVTSGDGVVISNNTIQNYGTANVTYQQSGILAAANNLTISNNTINTGTAVGITASVNGKAAIIGNKISNVGGIDQDAIYINSHALKDYAKGYVDIEDNVIDTAPRNWLRIANTDNYMEPGIIQNNTYSNTLDLVDNSGSTATNNINKTNTTDPTTPESTRKLIATVNIYDNGDVEKVTL